MSIYYLDGITQKEINLFQKQYGEINIAKILVNNELI